MYRYLIIEDDALNARYIAEGLRQQGALADPLLNGLTRDPEQLPDLIKRVGASRAPEVLILDLLAAQQGPSARTNRVGIAHGLPACWAGPLWPDLIFDDRWSDTRRPRRPLFAHGKLESGGNRHDAADFQKMAGLHARRSTLNASLRNRCPRHLAISCRDRPCWEHKQPRQPKQP